MLSIISGALAGLSFDFWRGSFLIWFSLVPLFFVIRRSSYQTTFLYSYLAGWTFFLFTLFWVGFVSRLGLFFLFLYLALYWALGGVLIKFFLRDKFSDVIFIPLLWVMMEFLQGIFLGGFGWTSLGYTQFRNLYLIQIANLGGTGLISFLIAAVNLVIFNLLRRTRFLAQLLFVGILGLTFLIYGWVTISQKPTSPESLEVSLIQPNIPQSIKWEEKSQEFILKELKTLGEKTREKNLLIFPEASLPFIMDEVSENYRYLTESLDRDLFLGVVKKEGRRFFNAAIIFDKSGQIKGVYKKIRLVPFGEYIPFRRFLSFIKVINSLGDISPGESPQLLSYKKAKIGTLICFEDIFPEYVSLLVKKGANILINIVNEAWFKGEPQAHQHLGIAVFRAIEQRRYIVRVANTGISTVITPWGEFTRKIPVNTRGILEEKVFLEENLTVYNKLGGRIKSGVAGLILARFFYLCWFRFIRGRKNLKRVR